jgi:hypothetical protein
MRKNIAVCALHIQFVCKVGTETLSERYGFVAHGSDSKLDSSLNIVARMRVKRCVRAWQ